MSDQVLARTQYQWHPDVHQIWGGEHLYFWRVGLHTGFDPDTTRDALTQVLEETGVRSYAAREMIGTVDLVLRTWLPRSVAATDFQKLLFERLQVVNAGFVDSFDVADVKYQWSWASGVPRRLRDFDLLAEAEESLSVSGGGEGAAVPALEQGGFLVRTGRDQGITFVMAIEGEVERLEAPARRRLTDLLSRVAEASEKVAEQALYEGSGFAAYLLVGRVDGNAINEVSELGSEILRLAREHDFPIKTTTMLSHPLEVLLYSECLPERAELPASAASSLEDMLRLGADALTDIREAVFTPGSDVGPDEQTGQTSFDSARSFFNTVASFLNSDGGVVILGAVPVEEWEAGRGSADEVLVVGDYACVGVESELGDGKWDDYEHRLEKLLEAHLEPSPMEWIEIDHEYLGGRLMVTVRVLEAGEGFFFFVGGPSQSAETFFVRRGDTTIELERSDADAYQRIGNAAGRLNTTDWSIVRALRQQRRLDRFQLASTVGMSAGDTDSALQRLIAGGYVTKSVGSDDVSRFELDPHWSDAGASPQRQKGSAS